LGDVPRALLLAELYLGHDQRYPLRSEAAEFLRQLPEYNKNRAVHQLLGKTYLEMGLFEEAQSEFGNALAIAREAGLPESEADALLGLGLAACLQGSPEVAMEHWLLARAQYEELGLVTQAQEAAEIVEATKDDCTR
jgi:tetratricopeptide (TPR) repeat protein